MVDLNIPPELVIEDLDTLKVIGDPTRMDLIRYIGTCNLRGERCTVKQLAKHLDIPPTKLYYHVNLLEEHGLLQVGETQIVSGIIEKHYQVSARSFRLAEDISSITDDKAVQDEMLEQLFAVLDQILDSASQDIRTSLQFILAEERAEKAGGPAARQQVDPAISSSIIYLTYEQAEELNRRMQELSSEFSAKSEENHRQGVDTGLYFNLTSLFSPLYQRSPNPDSTLQAGDEN